MSLFEECEREYTRLMGSVDRNIEAIPKQLGDRKSSMVRQTEELLDSAAEDVDKMKMEADHCTDSGKRLQWKPLVKEFAAEVNNKRRSLGEASAALASRNDLYDGYDGPIGRKTVSEDQRERLLDTSDSLQKSSDVLLRAQEQAAEIEMMGGDTMAELGKQKDTLRNSRRNIKTVHDQNRIGGKYLTYMWRRVQTNKMIMYCIICVLVFGIFLVLWFWWGGENMAAAAQGKCTIGTTSESKYPCPAGTFCDTEETKDCVKCPAGTYQPDEGKGSNSDCIKCPEKTGSQEGWAKCCPANTYNNDGGDMCHSCVKGKSSQPGATTCTEGDSPAPAPAPAPAAALLTQLFASSKR